MSDVSSLPAGKYVAPQKDLTEFHCPLCHVFSDQRWFHSAMHYANTNLSGSQKTQNWIHVSLCNHCQKLSIWIDESLKYPETVLGPIAHEDMPKEPQADYEEARSILAKSPRGASALLRVATEKLVISLVDAAGKKYEGLSEGIGVLVKEGMPVTIQQALDALRVIGNGAVHPGQLDLKDDTGTALGLLKLMNLIVQDRITQPKEIKKLFDEKLTQGQKAHIEERDKPAGS